jgi:hypothetical protein
VSQEIASQRARKHSRQAVGHKTAEAESPVKEAQTALALVQKARGVHNPPAEALLEAARQTAEAVIAAPEKT